MSDEATDAAALAYAARAEAEAARIDGLGNPPARPPIDSAIVVGAGTMGAGIAQVLAQAGIAVRLTDANADALARGLATIEKGLDSALQRGRLSREEASATRQRIETVPAIGHAPPSRLAIEAVIEDLAVKRQVFGELDASLPEDAILATNTSALDIDAIAAATRRPHSVIGTHFFSPAPVMRLQENVRGTATAPATIAAAMALAPRLGKIAVLARNAPGFIGNRILHAYQREADFLLEEGATPWQVDEAMMRFGFPMGIYRVRDLAGLDVGWRIRLAREATRDRSLRYSPVADRLCERGRFGQKTGAGFYRYEGRTPIPDPETERLIEATADELHIPRAPVTEEAIVTRIMAALVNEAARLLGEGVAQRASDIDVVYLNGYGFPRRLGGPMYWAERHGLARLLDSVRELHATHGRHWTPAPLLVGRAGEGSW